MRSSFRRRFAMGCTIAAASIVSTQAVHAQRTHVVLIQGLSGEPSYAPVFKSVLTTIADAAKTSWNVSDSSLFLLTEDGAGTKKSTPRTSIRFISSKA